MTNSIKLKDLPIGSIIKPNVSYWGVFLFGGEGIDDLRIEVVSHKDTMIFSHEENPDWTFGVELKSEGDLWEDFTYEPGPEDDEYDEECYNNKCVFHPDFDVALSNDLEGRCAFILIENKNC